MIKALIKKQMQEVRFIYLQRQGKKGQSSRRRSPVGALILFAISYLLIMGGFLAFAFLLGDPLMKKNLAWVFFMIMNIMAFIIGIIGSVFTTAETLFKAKDNEFLQAMPIPPSYILLSRMVSVYIMSLIYSSVVSIPAVLFYFVKGHPSFFAVIFSILGIFILALTVLTFSCFFGWIVALVSTKLKNKSAITVLIAIVFIGLFVLFRIRANEIFRSLAENAENLGESVKGWGYPLYSLGLGMSGNAIGFLAGLAIAAALFALTWGILSKSFGKAVSSGAEKTGAVFKDEQIRSANADAALRRKEMKQFTSSPGYMLNTGLSLLFLLAVAVFMLIETKSIRAFLEPLYVRFPIYDSMMPVVGTFVICFLASMTGIAAPAISLEGKRVWILQSMPLDPYRIFKAKLFVHIVITIVPSIICAGAMIFVLKTSVIDAVGIILCVAAFILADASFMLALDLRRPMMDWTNEVQPIKQNLNLLFSWLGGLVATLVFTGLYVFAARFIGAGVYLIILTAVFTGIALLFHKWFKGKGCERFARL